MTRCDVNAVSARMAFVADVERRVRAYGLIEISLLATQGLDDPDEHPIREFVRVLEEPIAARENRRPHIEAPRTLFDDLQAMAKRNGWRMGVDALTRNWTIARPISPALSESR